MTARTCKTCKHYEPSAVWHRGWCRNPRLYAPQQSHLVDQDSLDCSRGLGNAWESAVDDDRPAAEPASGTARLRLFAPGPRLVPAGAVLAASSGSGGGADAGGGGRPSTGGRTPSTGPPRPDRPGPPPGQERTVSYQPEERYWTDYLRIALPVLGLLLILGLFWYWAANLLGNGDDQEPTRVALVTPEPTNVALSAASPTAPAQPPAVNPTPISTTTAPAAAAVAPAATTTDQPNAAGEPCSVTTNFAPGSTVFTTELINLRSGPSVDSDAVAELPANTQLQVTGAFEEAGGQLCDWWPVTNTATNQSGFVREDLLRQ